MVGSAWSGDAVRDVLLAIAMAEGGKKPCPKWEKVEGIMTDWGYGFSASAIKQHFNKKIWRDIVESRGEGSPAMPAKCSAPSTPKKRGRKKPKASESTVNSETDLSEPPSKKRKTPVKNGHNDEDDDEDVKTPVKEEVNEAI